MSLGNQKHNELEIDLASVWASYRDACPDQDGGANFMPALWSRIEARRNLTFEWALLSRRVLAAAATLCLLFGGVIFMQLQQSHFYQATYVEALEQEDETEVMAVLHPVLHVEGPDR